MKNRCALFMFSQHLQGGNHGPPYDHARRWQHNANAPVCVKRALARASCSSARPREFALRGARAGCDERVAVGVSVHVVNGVCAREKKAEQKRRLRSRDPSAPKIRLQMFIDLLECAQPHTPTGCWLHSETLVVRPSSVTPHISPHSWRP